VSFRAHQQRFDREREEYFSATLGKARAAIRNETAPPLRGGRPIADQRPAIFSKTGSRCLKTHRFSLIGNCPSPFMMDDFAAGNAFGHGKRFLRRAGIIILAG